MAPHTVLRHPPTPRKLTDERRRRRFALSLSLLFMAALAGADPPAQDPTTSTLPVETVVPVDLGVEQRKAEQAEALRRAQAVAAARGISGPVRSIPEIDLIAREVLGDLPAVPTRFAGAEAGWRVRGRTPPELLAQRIAARLLGAGFSSTTRCAGDEWRGARGESHVAVRVEESAVSVRVLAAAQSCDTGFSP